MAEGEVNITQFDDAGTLSGTEKIYLVRGTTDYNTTPNAIVASEANTRATADNTLQWNITSEANARASADALKADKSTEIISGDGLTGGGDLSANRTLAVGTTNDSISVAADGISVAVGTLSGSSTTKPAQEKAVVDALALKAPLANPTFTGSVVVPTADAANEAVSKGQMDNADAAQSFAAAVLTNPFTASKAPRRIGDVAINTTSGEIWQATATANAAASWNCISAGYYNGRIITNWDTHTQSGDITSYGSATGAPTNTESFYGHHINSNAGTANAVQWAIGYTTNKIYMRTKTASTWGAWSTGITAVELGYLSGVTSNIQAQLIASRDEQIQGGIYDVSSHNDGAVFESLSTLLGSANLSTFIPTSVRRGGMSIRFIQGSVPNSDNKYVEYFLTKDEWSANVDDWEKINLEKELSQSNVEINRLKGDVDGLPQVDIDLSEYELSIGRADDNGTYYTSGNYGLYHRSKFVPVGDYAGRTIRLTKGTAVGDVAILKSMPDLTAPSSQLDFATGYPSIIKLTGSMSPLDIESDDVKYIYYYVRDTRTEIDYSLSAITVVSEYGKFYTKQETDEKIDEKIEEKIDEELTNYYTKEQADEEFLTEDDIEDINEIVFKEESVINIHSIEDEGCRYTADGTFVSDAVSQRGIVIIPVVEGASYKITTYILSTLIPGVIYTSDQSVTIGQDLTTVLGTQYTGSGTGQMITNQPLTIPNGTTFIIAQSAKLNEVEGQEVTETKNEEVPNVYTKDEADNKFATKSQIPVEGKYGVKWSISDADDLGQRCFDAVGLTAIIGQGNTNGSSHFDSIFPWSDIKRCNIKVNANGAKIVTFEGETGFALDGSNGDVFVRIPKFYVEKYIDNGYEYRVVSRNQGFTHPAFIENGKEIDEIFIGAFEGFIDSNNKLRSKGGVIPTSNEVASTFLTAATDNGDGYTLYDMRAVDAIWTLASVEYGKRNTNQYLGYGFADFMQPASLSHLIIKEAATNTNSVKVPLMQSSVKRFMPVGTNITVCDTNQTTILTQAKITAVTDGADYTQFTFDGSPIDVTTNCFIGSAACTANFSETCGNEVKLNWHTGRPLFVSGTYADRQNPIRYRWIENIIGSLWHFLPDVTFNNLQMYVCDNIKDYEFFKYTSPYRPVGVLLPVQTDNGQKNGNAGVNHWVSALLDDIFAKGNCFGKSFDNNLTSQKAFGAFYYLSDGTTCISNGGGFDHEIRCNMLTNRAWQVATIKWYLYGARLMYKNLD